MLLIHYLRQESYGETLTITKRERRFMTKEAQENNERLLQWHPAFYAGIQIEFAGEADKLIFEREYNLGTKPMQIDVVIIKKRSDEVIHKNLGRIFRRYNIVEYKSPTDYLCIDDFYKVYGYACFYKALSKKVNEVKVNDLTITFVCKNYPREMMEHLIEVRKMAIEKYDKGIYYIYGDIFPIQLILTSELSEDTNLWLRNLTNDLDSNKTIEKLANEYEKHDTDELYKSVMNIIIRANKERFKEAKDMCEALRELFADELNEKVSVATTEERRKGIKVLIQSSREYGISRENVLDKLKDKYSLTIDMAEVYMKEYW